MTSKGSNCPSLNGAQEQRSAQASKDYLTTRHSGACDEHCRRSLWVVLGVVSELANVLFQRHFPSVSFNANGSAHAFLTHAILVVFFLAAAYRRFSLHGLQLAASCVPFMRTLRIYERSRCLLSVGFVGFVSAADDLRQLCRPRRQPRRSGADEPDAALGGVVRASRRALFEEFFLFYTELAQWQYLPVESLTNC